MCRLPQGPLPCLFNACENTLPLFLSLCLTHTHMRKWAAETESSVLTPYNLMKHIYFYSKQNLEWQAALIIWSKTSVLAACLHLTAIYSFDINPSQSNSSIHFFISLQAGRDLLFCFDSLHRTSNIMQPSGVHNSSSASDGMEIQQGWR